MEGELFSPEWAAAWKSQINSSTEYQAAASKWIWPLTVRVDAGPAWRLDLYEGVCRHIVEANAGPPSEFVIAGSLEAWLEVLHQKQSPISALMKRSLRLERGSMMKIARYTAAAKYLLEAATRASGMAAGSAAVSPASQATVHGGSSAEVDKKATSHSSFRTTTPGGIDFDSFPMQLYAKAKRFGVWDPANLSFERDVEDWSGLAEAERDVLLRLIAMFQAGEEAVTLDLLPLIRIIAREGRIEEEMYLTTFLFEEAKHVEFFRRFLDSIGAGEMDLGTYHTPAYRALFYDELPAALSALDTDASPLSQLRASSTYNMVVEGVLAETGYHALYEVLDSRSILPGLRKGIGLLQRDESRHIAYGVYLLSRLIEADESLLPQFNERMEALLPQATDVIAELFAAYPVMPFDLQAEDFIGYAMDQFGKRLKRIDSGSSASPAG